MDTKLYLTIAGIIAILYGLGFLLIPEQLNVLLGGLSEPHVIYAQRVFAGAALAWGLILWFARDFRDWDAVRGVLIGSIVGLVVLTIASAWATIQGLQNTLSWSNPILGILLLLGAWTILSTFVFYELKSGDGEAISSHKPGLSDG